MVVIFLFSNQQGNASSVTSNKVTKEIIEVLEEEGIGKEIIKRNGNILALGKAKEIKWLK